MCENKEEYLGCYWIQSGLNFQNSEVRFCCYEYINSDERIILKNNYSGELLDDAFFEKIKQYKTAAKQGDLPVNCRNCMYLTKRTWSDDIFVDRIIFNHWYKCNSNCIYCYSNDLRNRFTDKPYNIFPVLKDLKNRGILHSTNDDCMVFGGGEPTILEEFDDIMQLLLTEGFKNIRINSSGIKYSKLIEEGLKSGVVSLVISPDSGTRNMYKTIKRVDCYDKVWKNIHDYAAAQKNDRLVMAKYIIIPDINDTKEEIDAWFEMVLKNNIKSISYSVEQSWFMALNPHFPPYIYQLLDYIHEKADKAGLYTEVYIEAKSILEKREASKNV